MMKHEQAYLEACSVIVSESIFEEKLRSALELGFLRPRFENDEQPGENLGAEN
jgi:hypothetical protein